MCAAPKYVAGVAKRGRLGIQDRIIAQRVILGKAQVQLVCVGHGALVEDGRRLVVTGTRPCVWGRLALWLAGGWVQAPVKRDDGGGGGGGMRLQGDASARCGRCFAALRAACWCPASLFYLSLLCCFDGVTSDSFFPSAIAEGAWPWCWAPFWTPALRRSAAWLIGHGMHLCAHPLHGCGPAPDRR